MSVCVYIYVCIYIYVCVCIYIYASMCNMLSKFRTTKPTYSLHWWVHPSLFYICSATRTFRALKGAASGSASAFNMACYWLSIGFATSKRMSNVHSQGSISKHEDHHAFFGMEVQAKYAWIQGQLSNPRITYCLWHMSWTFQHTPNQPWFKYDMRWVRSSVDQTSHQPTWSPHEALWQLFDLVTGASGTLQQFDHGKGWKISETTKTWWFSGSMLEGNLNWHLKMGFDGRFLKMGWFEGKNQM